MFLPTRGVRPTARAGAFVAGADDLGALWFNPAGMASGQAWSAHRLFVDVSFVAQQVTYQRIDSGLTPQETVENQAPGMPIPAVAVSGPIGRNVVLGGGIFAPYAALGKYSVDGPQRYSLVDMSRSALVVAEVAMAWRISERLRLGVGLQNMFASVVTDMVLSGCPGQTLCAPEDPEFDSLGRVHMREFFSPSAVLGGQYDLASWARVGVALQLPFRVAGGGTIQVALPDSGFFDGASVSGDYARVGFTLPAMARIGIELEPRANWRLEAGVDVETWSMHDELMLDATGVAIENSPGVGTYEVGKVVVPRGFEDTVAWKLGAEVQPVDTVPLTVAAGYAFETAAAPDRLLSVMTVDGDKHLFGGGVGYVLGDTRLYASASFVRVADRAVAPEEGTAPQLTPIRPDNQAAPLTTYVNWGEYQSLWFTAGLGVEHAF
jgi:long-chain fatty acid transport protein